MIDAADEPNDEAWHALNDDVNCSRRGEVSVVGVAVLVRGLANGEFNNAAADDGRLIAKVGWTEAVAEDMMLDDDDANCRCW
jgi:hypothetical protein